MSSSSFSGFMSPSVIPIILSSIITSSSANAPSNVCTATYVTTMVVMSVKPDFTHKSISDLGEPSRKRKHCGSSSGLSQDDMWKEFQQLMASCSAAGHTSSPSHSRSMRGHCFCSPLPLQLISGTPGETSLFSPAHLTCSTRSICFACTTCL